METLKKNEMDQKVQLLRLSLFCATAAIYDDLVVAGRKTPEHLESAMEAASDIRSHFVEKYGTANLPEGTPGGYLMTYLDLLVGSLNRAIQSVGCDMHLMAVPDLLAADDAMDTVLRILRARR